MPNEPPDALAALVFVGLCKGGSIFLMENEQLLNFPSLVFVYWSEGQGGKKSVLCISFSTNSALSGYIDSVNEDGVSFSSTSTLSFVGDDFLLTQLIGTLFFAFFFVSFML